MRSAGGRSYGLQYRMPFGGLDGFRYRVDVYVKGESDTSPTELDPAGAPCEVRWGRPGGISTLWQPLLPSSMTFRFVARTPSALTELISGNSIDQSDPYVQDDDAILAVLQFEGGTDVWVDAWAGYVLPDSVTDYLFEPGVVEITAYDGFGLWQSEVYEPPADYTTALETILDNISSISALGVGYLYTLCQWYPFRSSSDISSSADPLTAIYTSADAWVQDDLYTLRYDVMRQMVGRFGMELFQSGGHWWCVQPYQLNTAVFTSGSRGKIYDTDGSLVYVWDASSVEQASSAYPFRIGSSRTLGGAVKDVGVTYDFIPSMESVVLNHGFETEGSGGSTTALHWTFDSGTNGSTYRSPLNGVSTLSWTNRFCLVLESESSTAYAGATQSGFVTIPSERNTELHFGFTSWGYPINPPGIPDEAGFIKFKVGSFNLRLSTIETAVDAVKGDNTVVAINAAFLDPETFSGHIAGTPVLPEGTEIRFTDGISLTLTEPARVGDYFLRGRLSDELPAESSAEIAWFEDSETTTNIKLSVQINPTDTSFRTYMLTPTGNVVSGSASIEVWTPEATPTDYFGQILEEVRATIAIEGRAVQAITHSASTGRRGQALQTDTFIIGDGPSLESVSGLHIDDGSGGTEPSLQGVSVGWQNGAYSGGTTSGRSIDAHHARELLRTSLRGVEERNISLLLRDKARFGAHNILTHTHETTSETMRLWRRHLVWDVAQGEVSGVFQRLYYDTDEDVVEAITALSEGSGARHGVSLDTYVPPADPVNAPTWSDVDASYESSAVGENTDTFGPWVAEDDTEVSGVWLFVHPHAEFLGNTAWSIPNDQVLIEGWDGDSWVALTTTTSTDAYVNGDSIQVHYNLSSGYTKKRITVEIGNLFSQHNPHPLSLVSRDDEDHATTVQTSIMGTQS